MSKRILVLGMDGQLGRALQNTLPTAKFMGRAEMDLMDQVKVKAFPWADYDYIILAAAWTKVDLADSPQHQGACWYLNTKFPYFLMQEAKKATIIYISTDYVFDGKQESAYTENDTPKPLNQYGQSKWMGEQLLQAHHEPHYIIRTSWLIGDGPNFVRTMIDRARKGEEVQVVIDQFGRPTMAEDLAKFIAFLIDKQAPYGTYNFSCQGDILNWMGIALLTYREMGHSNTYKTLVHPITSNQYLRTHPQSVPRPKNSMLNLERVRNLGYDPLDWRQALPDYIKANR